MRFDEILENDDMLDALWDMHFDDCTPIQEQAIPIIKDKKDLIAVAQTGTGKTAAYLLPVIEMLASGDYSEEAVNCIVMAPTRELAQQIDNQMQGFAYFLGLSSVAIYGGTDGHTFQQQKNGLTMGADVVIATPGRLLAHLSMGYVDLSKVSFFILDEADRMLDMGFFDDIMQIAAHLPKDRQTLLFSATMPPKIQMLASKILNNPAEIKLAVSKPADKITQLAYVCYEPQKLPLLRSLFKRNKPNRVIVFASSKLKVKELYKALRGDNIKVGEMHSDLEQAKRDQIILDFKAGRVNVLVATDIVSRGIDIDDIETVINFDVPGEPEDYVHRIGRTARADAEGTGITFISDKDKARFRRIEQLLESEVPKGEVPQELGETPSWNSRESGRRSKCSKSRRQGGIKQKNTVRKTGDSTPINEKNHKREKVKDSVAKPVNDSHVAEKSDPDKQGAPNPKSRRRRRHHNHRKTGDNITGSSIVAIPQES